MPGLYDSLFGAPDPFGFGRRASNFDYSQHQMDALNRQQQSSTYAQVEMLRRAQQYRPDPAPPRSKFDTPDVIDLVEDSDGVFRVPAQLEYRARER